MSAVNVDRAAFARVVREKLAWVLGVLVTKGWPELPEWWRALYSLFLPSPCRQLVVRAGRRGGKSSWACLFATAFALVYSGLGLVPPGDVGWVVFVSVSREEAQSRLRTIKQILDVLRVKYSPDGDTLIIAGTNIGFRVQSCTVASVSGWTSILIIADEVAKWRDRDDGHNPAREVIAALRPTMATQPLAVLLMLSSPIGNEDAHAKAYAQGDSDFQLTAYAPTWIANPTISEQETHKLEPDERVWRREYLAQPQGALLPAFDPDAVEHAFAPMQIDAIVSNSVLGLDPAGFGKDRYGICSGAWGLPMHDPDDDWEWTHLPYDDGSPSPIRVRGARKPRTEAALPAVLYLWAFSSIDSSFRQGMGIEAIADTILQLSRDVQAKLACTDRSEAFSLVSLLSTRGLKTEVFSFGGGQGVRTVSRMRQLLNARAVHIEADHRVKQQFLAFQERIGPNGLNYDQGRDEGGGHFDDVSAALQIVRADIEGHLSGSPASGGPSMVVYRPNGEVITVG